MAIIRSSKGTTSTNGGAGRRVVGWSLLLSGVAAGSVLLNGSTGALPVPQAKAPTPTPSFAMPQEHGSFFDPLDRIDAARWTVSDDWTNGDHQGCTWSRDNVSVSKGVLQIRLGRAADRLRPYRCGEIKSTVPFGYGTYEVRMRTAAGSGLNSNMFTYSGKPLTPVHDEIDFEFLGKSSGTVQLNFFASGKGDHGTLPELGFDTAAGFNDYAFNWTPGRIRWYVNGKLVRDASGTDLPKVPGNLILSLWNGTKNIEDWLGPFDAARTPVAAEFDWIAYTKTGERCRFPQSVTCKLP
ncbi:family 16 glycosylhydrolase [uncultured Sphingomonas sp.]|uniref:family 16 glycosylhydrolase n=1 Tax=uncultured Sphingomonas sp. TaxID=158754 RepID=UPI0035C95FF4